VSAYKVDGYVEVYPVTTAGVEMSWKTLPRTLEKSISEGSIIAKKDDDGIIIVLEKIREGQVVKTHWVRKEYNAIQYGTKLLNELLGRKDFSYPKSLYLVIDTLKLMTSDDDIILDFYAGSGTTGHATLELNKEDSGNRKFILIEQLDEHIKICVERNQKVIATQKLKDTFVYTELAKWNEQAKEEISNAKDLPELTKLLDTLYEKYFLNYNVRIKDFKEKIVKEDNFKKLTLPEQKRMFLTMLDLNQMYVQESEMADKRFGISKEDQKLTMEFYKN